LLCVKSVKCVNSIRKMTTKQCNKCEETKDIGEFYAIKGGTAIRGVCKKCDNAASRDYKARNRQKVSAYNETWKKDNQKPVSDYNKKYNTENREAIQKRQSATRRIRNANDPNFKLTCQLRWRLYKYIKSQGTNDSDYMKDLIGCNWEAFEVWLRYQFNDQMTFANYGTYWHIDHVQPCCIFDVTDKRLRELCFHWSNLRPLKKEENQSKTGKIVPEEIGDHIILIEEFLAQLSKQDQKNYTTII
jgi:hypothetical protein